MILQTIDDLRGQEMPETYPFSDPEAAREAGRRSGEARREAAAAERELEETPPVEFTQDMDWTAFREKLLRNPKYMAGLFERILRGNAPAIEKLVWEAQFGKPAQTIKTETTSTVEASAAIARYQEELDLIIFLTPDEVEDMKSMSRDIDELFDRARARRDAKQ